MAAPKWAMFMRDVYADKKLDYGKLLKFDQPAELKNNPIYAEQNFANIAKMGDSLNNEENDENSVEYFGSDMNDEMLDDKTKKDTILKKKEPAKKSSDYR